MFEYFKQVKAELRHVAWPSREQTTAFTAVVIGISLVIAIYLGLLDYFFSAVLLRIL
jgi:preprotein translocase subunit SecE